MAHRLRANLPPLRSRRSQVSDRRRAAECDSPLPLLPLPSVPTETKASSLLRSGTRKPTTDRDQYVHLWHNYAVFACGVAPSSTGVRVEARLGKASPEHAESYEAKMAASQSSAQHRANARDLFKLLCPLLRCDVPDLAGSVVSALGRINPAAFR